MTTPFFAEFLPRLKTVSVCVEYPSDEITSLQTDKDGANVVLKRSNQADILFRLPVRSISSFEIDVKSVSKDGYMAFKLPVCPNDSIVESAERSRTLDSLTTKDAFLWSAKELRAVKSEISEENTSQIGFLCAKCKELLIPFSRVRRIDAMPSEFWSEMMEFWHCERPETGGPNSYETVRERFGSFHPRKCSLIVGSYYLVLNAGDFHILPGANGGKYECPFCHTSLESSLDSSGNDRFPKWNFLLRNGKLEDAMSFPPYLYPFSVLMDNISSSAIRFFDVHLRNSDTSIVVWCFNFGLDVTSAQNGRIMHNCLKIFYQDAKAAIDAFKRNTNHTQYTTVEFEQDAYDSLYKQLTISNSSLPKAQQTFKDWKVAYLPERW